MATAIKHSRVHSKVRKPVSGQSAGVEVRTICDDATGYPRAFWLDCLTYRCARFPVWNPDRSSRHSSGETWCR